MIAWQVRYGIVVLAIGASIGCFHSDFLLYGAPCCRSADCDDVFGDGRGSRVCFFPGQAPGSAGYCAVGCEPDDPSTCAPGDGRSARCIERARSGGGTTWVCALDCETAGDCPDDMQCLPDPEGGEWSLCVPGASPTCEE